MSVKRSFTRLWKNKKSNNTNKVKYLLGALAMGMTMLPGSAEAASTITKLDGTSAIQATNNMHNIYAQQISGSVATNKFKDFNLDANQIANLYFRTNPAGVDANALVNFVNNQININGTINVAPDTDGFIENVMKLALNVMVQLQIQIPIAKNVIMI